MEGGAGVEGAASEATGRACLPRGPPRPCDTLRPPFSRSGGSASAAGLGACAVGGCAASAGGRFLPAQPCVAGRCSANGPAARWRGCSAGPRCLGRPAVCFPGAGPALPGRAARRESPVGQALRGPVGPAPPCGTRGSLAWTS